MVSAALAAAELTGDPPWTDDDDGASLVLRPRAVLWCSACCVYWAERCRQQDYAGVAYARD